ncbi:MAG: hypothetical protein ACRDGL_06300, partial [Candidatus Limnocylindrales bacterium]
MNNEQLERELRLALLHDDPGPVPDELRWRIEVVPDELPRRVGAAQRSGAWRLLAALALTAAVGVVGVVIARSLPGRPVSVGPTTHPQATMSPGPSSSPSPSLIVPVPGAWGGLRWSAPGSIAGPGAGLDSLVTFDGRFFVSATVPAGSSAEVAIWQSADGTTWTRLAPGGGVFAGAQHVTLVATSRGLVAWGPVGQPVCTAPGAGQTCGPAPVMIWSSPDGTTWTRTPEASPFAGATIRSMAGGPAGLVVVGDTGFDGPAIWGSADGTAWQRLPLPASIFGQAHFETVG